MGIYVSALLKAAALHNGWKKTNIKPSDKRLTDSFSVNYKAEIYGVLQVPNYSDKDYFFKSLAI